MKKILTILIAATLLTSIVLPNAVCYAADDAPELKLPARETFREFYHKWNDIAADKKNGVKGQHLKITVTPAELPYPLLKYRFNTYITETESGNAAPLYSEAVARLNDVWTRTSRRDVYESRDYAKAKFPELFNTPTEKKEEETVKKLLFKAFPLKPYFEKVFDVVTPKQEEELFISLNGVYRLIEKASKKRECDWSYQMEYHGIVTLLDHVQNMRGLARYLDGKAEWEIRNGKYNDAVKTIRLGLRLAEHLEQSDTPCLVTLLIATAIKGIMLKNIQLLSTQPDSPNLYPALTQLARDKNTFQKGLQEEQFMWLISDSNPQKIQELFEQADENNKESCKTLLKSLTTTFVFRTNEFVFNAYSPKLREQEDTVNNAVTVVSLVCYPYGKERLLKRGLTEAEIDKLSVYQVVTPYIAEEIKTAYDKLLVTSMLPVDFKRTITDFIDDEGFRADSPLSIYLALILPAVQSARAAFLRTEQTIDLLQITEAIRYYAAVNDGKLPETLEKIEQLYVNTIGATNNKPFAYRVEGNTAIIDYFVNVGGDESRLEITVEKK
ncbi:MAG: hypothetical protein LBK82_14665 [Planctomycetaceae bacterium]|nr:hypothetical protein [Planctomycetaceae bacterium]